MKRIISFIFLYLLIATSSWGWGRLGHAVVAKIAENHMTPTTAAKVAEILNNESIVLYASYADDFKSTKELQVDFGVDFTDGNKRKGSYPHTFEVDMNFNPFRGVNDNGRYVKNCIYFIEKFAENLKNYKTMSPEERFMELVLIVHFVGDMHCPEHIRYNPEDMTIGYYNIKYRGEDLRYHTFWDKECLTDILPFSYSDIATLLDTHSKDEYKDIVKGTPYDWGYDCAKNSYPIHSIKEGTTLSKKWINEVSTPLTKKQLTNGGYRLAELLNRIFDK